MMLSDDCLWEISEVSKNPVILSSFIIRNLHSGMVLDVPGSNEKKGTYIIQYDRNNRLNQRWKFIKVNEYGGCYLIENVRTGLLLDVKGAHNKDG